MTLKSFAAFIVCVVAVAGTGQSETEKQFSYPPGYMRREPLIHQATVDLFHTEGTIRITDKKLFEMKADIANYYHLENAQEVDLGIGPDAVAESRRQNETVTVSNQVDTDKKKWWDVFRPIEY